MLIRTGDADQYLVKEGRVLKQGPPSTRQCPSNPSLIVQSRIPGIPPFSSQEPRSVGSTGYTWSDFLDLLRKTRRTELSVSCGEDQTSSVRSSTNTVPSNWGFLCQGAGASTIRGLCQFHQDLLRLLRLCGPGSQPSPSGVSC